MVESILSNIIEQTFEIEACRGQRFDGNAQMEKYPWKGMHIGFSMHPNYDEETQKPDCQYRTFHVILFGPCNYIYLAAQEDVIYNSGERHLGPMEILCYHDSCWRDALQRFIFEHRDKICSFKSEHSLTDWYDIIEVTKDENDFLYEAERAHREKRDIRLPNPFTERWERT